jgi:hypothetical protein
MLLKNLSYRIPLKYEYSLLCIWKMSFITLRKVRFMDFNTAKNITAA